MADPGTEDKIEDLVGEVRVESLKVIKRVVEGESAGNDDVHVIQVEDPGSPQWSEWHVETWEPRPFVELPTP